MVPFDRTNFPDVERVIKAPASRWDKKIAADLISEMEAYFGKVDTIPQMKQALAIAGYQGLQRHIEKAVAGKTGADAVRAMAMRCAVLRWGRGWPWPRFAIRTSQSEYRKRRVNWPRPC